MGARSRLRVSDPHRVPGSEASDEAVLRPRELYEDQGRADEYERVVERLKREREEFLRGVPAIREEIVGAVRG